MPHDSDAHCLAVHAGQPFVGEGPGPGEGEGDAVNVEGDMTVVAVNGVAVQAGGMRAEDEFDDDFFAIDGEEIELKKQHVKKKHRSYRGRLRGKHKARRAVDAAYPTPYETGTSRNGGEDIYGLNAEESQANNTGGGVKIAKGKKKLNRKYNKNNREGTRHEVVKL